MSATPHSATPAAATARSTPATASTKGGASNWPSMPSALLRSKGAIITTSTPGTRTIASMSRTASSVSICTQQVMWGPTASEYSAGVVAWRACATNGPHPRVPAGG